MARSYSDTELLAVLLSREVRGGETSACGALSMIPAAALLLARAHHAPGAEVIILGSPAFFPFPTSRQFHYLAQRGDLDLFFVSGVQIDQQANYNLHQIGGERDRPQIRFPGGYGGGMIYYVARRSIIFRTEHTRRTFVEQVDFISAKGSTPPETLRLGAPSKVITPMATLRLNPETRLLDLESVHAPHTPWDVAANTGFELVAADGRPAESAPATPPPTEDELKLLRGSVRETMITTGTYANWAQAHLGGGRHDCRCN